MTLDPDSARRKMIQQQIRCWNVSNPRVLNALQTVPREHFVAAEFAALAFADTRLPIDASTSKTMLTPQLEGRILQALDPGPDDKVLEVGTGSGYLTACLARLARHVTSIDVSPARIEAAEARLADLGITNCELQVQDVYERREATSYDVIAVTGSIAAYDPRFEQWLNPGGRAFIVVGTAPAMEACLIVQAVDGGTRVESLFETVVPPLTIAGNAAEPAFRF
ncbi:MAG: protein-L-isoaspartate O-methyltransferase [Gammaproteobacteria bacterium]